MYKNILLKSIFFVFCLGLKLGYAAPNATEHFKLNVLEQPQGIHLSWDIAPDAFIYKDRIHWKTDPSIEFKSIVWPKAKMHTDKLGISHEVYQQHFELTLPYAKLPQQSTFNFSIQYQGCSLKGVCFPPQTQNLMVKGKSNHILLELLSFLGLGILLAFTPCVLPMLPIMTKIVIGDQSQKTRQTFALSLAYILGMASTYAAVGAVIASIGKNLFILMQQTWISLLMSCIFIGLGIATLGYFEIQLPQGLQQKTLGFRSQLKSGRYLSAFIMGSISLLVLSPCVTAPLLAALTYITQLGQVWRGSLALFCLGLGMGLPLMLFAVSAGHYLPKVGTWMEQIKKILALLLFGVAAMLLSRSLAHPWSMVIWPCFFIVTLILFRPLANESLKLKSIKLIFFLALAALLVTQIHHPHPKHSHHQIIEDQSSLNKILAQNPKHPSILYFSAKWCTTCKYLEQKVWNNQAIKPLLAEANLIKVDLSNHSKAQEEIMKTYQVIAPPTVILIDPTHPRQSCRLLGEEITIPKLKHWQDILHQAWSMRSCD
jgi:thiol:disulfide interchange protein DsbD